MSAAGQQQQLASSISADHEVNELNARNTSLSSKVSIDSSGNAARDYIPYSGLSRGGSSDLDQGWFFDESSGEWCYDPTLHFINSPQNSDKKVNKRRKQNKQRSESIKSSSSQSDKNKNAHMPSSNAMSDNIYNYDQDQEGDTGYPDNYEEGWYQDEYGNWLNQFDWKQVIWFDGEH